MPKSRYGLGRAMRSPPLAIRASARFEQRVQRPLAIRGRRRVERRVATSLEKCGGENLVPVEQRDPRGSRKDQADTDAFVEGTVA